VVRNGITFDSRPEADRWDELVAERAAGRITNLTRQVVIRVVINGVFVFRYTADFQYMRDGKRVVEDVKSPYTAKFREWKRTRKIIKALYNLDIVEVIRGKKRGAKGRHPPTG
jgi:hypothetical protein